MEHMPVFGALMEERYGKSPVVMQPLPSTVPGRRHVYRIELGDGQRWGIVNLGACLQGLAQLYAILGG